MDDLQLTCFKEPETLADVDIHLRVAAGADGERTLLLGIEGVLPGEISLDGVCLLKRGIDQVHPGIALAEVLLHDGIVRAAENKVFDLLAGEDIVDLRSDLKIDVVLVEIAAVNERRQQGRAFADDVAVRIALVDQLGIFAGGDREFGSDQTDGPELLADDILRGFFDDADDLIIEAGTKPVSHGGDGVAGDRRALHAVAAKEPEHVAAQLKNLIRGFVAVRAVGAVAEIDNVFPGKNALQLLDDRQTTNAGVHDTDGIGRVQHGKFLLKIICKYCITRTDKCKSSFIKRQMKKILQFVV